MNLSIQQQIESHYSIFYLKGKPLSDHDFEDLYSQIQNLFTKDIYNVILDLSGIELLNSSGVGAIIKLFTKCRNQGGDLVIVNISDKISHVLVLTKLNTVLNIATSLDEAKNQFIEE